VCIWHVSGVKSQGRVAQIEKTYVSGVASQGRVAERQIQFAYLNIFRFFLKDEYIFANIKSK